METLISGSGWLMLSMPFSRKPALLTGEVLRWDVSMKHGLYGSQAHLGIDLAPGTWIDTADPDKKMWQALQSWPDKAKGRAWPPEMKALLELARRHPEEYEELREGEAVIRALGGLP